MMKKGGRCERGSGPRDEAETRGSSRAFDVYADSAVEHVLPAGLVLFRHAFNATAKRQLPPLHTVASCEKVFPHVSTFRFCGFQEKVSASDARYVRLSSLLRVGVQ